VPIEEHERLRAGTRRISFGTPAQAVTTRSIAGTWVFLTAGLLRDASIQTPTTTTMAMTLPLILLFELTLILHYIFDGRKRTTAKA
jgi:Sec-independent protein secretion pathway component TatC